MSTRRASVIDQLYAAIPSLITAVTDPVVIADAPLKDRVAAFTAVDKFLYHLERLQSETATATQNTAQRADEPFDFDILYPGDPGYDDPDPWVYADDDSMAPTQPLTPVAAPVRMVAPLVCDTHPTAEHLHDGDDGQHAQRRSRDFAVVADEP